MIIDFAPTRLRLPTGTIPATWIGAIGDTCMVHIRYWKMDHKTARWNQVTTMAIYCPTHHICYLTSDYPNGCPECVCTNTNQSAALS